MQPTSPIYFLDMPIAENGDKTIIPAEEASAEGRATQSEGFPAITQTPIVNGGIAPNRWDFNGMFFLLSQLAFWQQSGGIMTWQSTLGYTPPCMVYYNSSFWVALQKSGPDTDAGAVTPAEGDYWTSAFNYICGETFAKSVTLTGDCTGTGTLDDDGDIAVTTDVNYADSAGSASKLGSTSAGSGTNPIYFSSGVPKASSSTVGSSTKPIYLNSGTLTASSSTVGSSSIPMWLKSGVFTACTDIDTVIGLSEVKLAQNGYALFSNGLLLQWGYAADPDYDDGGHSEHSNIQVTFQKEFSEVYAGGCFACSNKRREGRTYLCFMHSLTTTGCYVQGGNNTDGHAMPYWAVIGKAAE